jgi:hypothetical protein
LVSNLVFTIRVANRKSALKWKTEMSPMQFLCVYALHYLLVVNSDTIHSEANRSNSKR